MHSSTWSPFVSFRNVCHVCEWGITISSSGLSFLCVCVCVFRVRVMCWNVDMPSYSLRIRKGEAHCCVCHINPPSGMCHLFHSLNHTSLKRKDCHSCVFACIFDRLERSGLVFHLHHQTIITRLSSSIISYVLMSGNLSVLRSKMVISWKLYTIKCSFYYITRLLKITEFTFMLPCIVIDFILNNQPDALIIQIYSVINLYMFRASSVPIIRSTLLYIRHW